MTTGISVLLDVNNGSAIGTDGDDTFWTPGGNPKYFENFDWSHFTLNGAAGMDTLFVAYHEDVDLRKFASFSGIENITFSDFGGSLSLTGQQLAGINSIDASSSMQTVINLAGGAQQTFDLRNKTFTGDYVFRLSDSPSYPLYSDIVISDKNQLLTGSTVHLDLALRAGTRVHLVGDTFTAQERQQMINQGAVYVWDESDNGAANAAPVATGLNGDRVSALNQDWVYLDAGLNANVADDARIRKISVSVANPTSKDWIDFDYYSPIEFPDGIVEGGRIRDKTVFNGKVFANLYKVTNSSFEILFDGDATPNYVNEVVHSLIYQNTGFAAATQREVQITAWDGADKATTSTVVVTHKAVMTAPSKGGKVVGTSESNLIKGGAGNDVLYGQAGNDTIYGGAGKDVLVGGSGKDIFVFNTKPGTTNIDRLSDFSVRDDTIWLENAIFKKIGKGAITKPGALNKAYFKIGAPTDSNDYVIYNKKTGALFYDADGSGHGKAVQIAVLKAGLAMTYHDIFVI